VEVHAGREVGAVRGGGDVVMCMGIASLRTLRSACDGKGDGWSDGA
jgi:hypothetical protein